MFQRPETERASGWELKAMDVPEGQNVLGSGVIIMKTSYLLKFIINRKAIDIIIKL